MTFDTANEGSIRPSTPTTTPIEVVEWDDPARWDKFVERASDASVMHQWAWGDVIRDAYRHRPIRLAAVSEGVLVGVLPLTLMRSRIFGRHLVSMPYMDYGGVCANGDAATTRALVAAAIELTDLHGAVLELRHVENHELGLPASTEKVTMLLELDTDADAQWRRLSSERRNRIRKGQRLGVEAEMGGPEGLAEFYPVFATNMRDLGSPVHSKAFFREMTTTLGDKTRVLIVRSDGRAIGAAVVLLHAGAIAIPWVSSLRPYLSRCPNQVLYWEAIRWGIENGYPTLDFGRSSRDSGTFEAKRQWGCEPVQLHWHFYPESATPPAAEAATHTRAAAVWRRLPRALADPLGGRIRRSIPN
jgi:FemAB-related protein (PEP-CTERM system-associated)